MTSTAYAIAHEDTVYGVGSTVSEALRDAEQWFDEAGILHDDDRNDVYRITDAQRAAIEAGNVSLSSLGINRVCIAFREGLLR